ncbi:heavy-metal-associated domain-containing protein [Desulfobacula sp.]|uniref:heavy-metal-associated domain-containing protein n=1 Tax=Desulfobacula sp. TaxID=2593537 RepID=UPI00261DDF23|nr:heavy-metal-associated domain-containing protein [Desulfobacula sp.]
MKKITYIIFGGVGLVLVLVTGLVMAEKPQIQNLNRAVIKIDSLSCGGCFSSINAGLSSLEGYSGMGANLFRKLLAIDFTAPLTAEKLSQKLSEIGYPGKLETVDSILEKESFAYIDSKRSGLASAGGGCCGGGPSPDNNNRNQGSSNPIAPSGGSCCALPDVTQ